MRLNEVAGLLIPVIDLIHGFVHALCKGNKLDTVSITDTSMKELKNYLDERERLYKPDKKNQFVFLTKYRSKANPISVESIEKLVKKYSEHSWRKRLNPP